MNLRPISLKEAKAFVDEYHRHHKPSIGWKFGVGLEEDSILIGVIMAGRPVARMLDDGYTLEVTRCCTLGDKNASSMLYGAIRRAAKALGYKKCITYTLESESGISLKASGWTHVSDVRGRSWTTPSRPREDNHPLDNKRRWEVIL